MVFGTFVVVFILFCPWRTHGLSAVVVEPVREHGVEVALVVIPGSELRGESYLPLAECIQQESPLRLWVALTTDYLGDIPNLLQLSQAIDIALENLVSSGMPPSTPVFFAGHSRGGIVLQTYISRRPSVARGIMLWASYLTGDLEDLDAYPIPVMHLSGDLDGQVKITRIARPFRELEALQRKDTTSLATKPVIVVEGVNHFQFSSGEPSQEDVRRDLPAEVTAAEAWTILACVIKDFISYNLGVERETAFNDLAAYHQQTLMKMAPLTAAKDLECNVTSSAWIIEAQELVAAFPSDLQTPVTIYNVGYTDQRQFENSKPSVVKDSDGMAIIATRSKVEFPFNPIDFSSLMDSADEIAGKMKNQEAIKWIVEGDGYGDSATCRVINEAAYKYAYDVAPAIVQSRYDSRGKHMIFKDDVNMSTGSEWAYSHVTYEAQGDGWLQVTSSALYTNVDFPVVNLAGMYYCKLMSPYRALEWMYVDSLRPVATEEISILSF